MRQYSKIVLCACLLSMACLTGLAYGAPKAVVVSDSTYNAGDVLQGKPITHDFILKNEGNEALTIQVNPC
jgi:hypothetical protein